MADVRYWEERFIVKLIAKRRQERYLELLKGPKHRSKFLDELNHGLAYDNSKATTLDPQYKQPESLLAILCSMRVNGTCYLVADGNELDGREMRIELAVPMLLENYWGAVIICPPKPIAVYKPEDPGDLVLLQEKAA